MEKKRLVINHPSQLNYLSTLPVLHTAGVGKIVFSEAFQHPEKERWEQQLNKQYYACGCSQGAKALLIGLVVFGITGTAGYYYSQWSVPKVLTILFVGTIAMSMLGKLVGLISANRKLQQTISEIQAVWKPQRLEKDKDIIGCG